MLQRRKRLPQRNSWQDGSYQPTFILGGGPSLPKDLVPSLKGKGKVIATNDAYTIAPWADVLVFSDEIWYDWNAKKLDDVEMPIVGGCKTTKEMPNIYHWPAIENTGLIPMQGGTQVGNNAGHQAISLAVWLGSSEIVLLGFDMNIEVGNAQWHTNHKRETNQQRYASDMIPNLITSSRDIANQGTQVWNTNPNSAIPCFQYKSLDSFI